MEFFCVNDDTVVGNFVIIKYLPIMFSKLCVGLSSSFSCALGSFSVDVGLDSLTGSELQKKTNAEMKTSEISKILILPSFTYQPLLCAIADIFGL